MRTVAIPTSVMMLAASKKDNELYATLGITEEDYENWSPKADRAAKALLGRDVYNFLSKMQEANKKIPAIKEYIEYKVINRRPKNISREVVKTLDAFDMPLSTANVETSSKQEKATACSFTPKDLGRMDRAIERCSESNKARFEYMKKISPKVCQLIGGKRLRLTMFKTSKTDPSDNYFTVEVTLPKNNDKDEIISKIKKEFKAKFTGNKGYAPVPNARGKAVYFCYMDDVLEISDSSRK